MNNREFEYASINAENAKIYTREWIEERCAESEKNNKIETRKLSDEEFETYYYKLRKILKLDE